MSDNDRMEVSDLGELALLMKRHHGYLFYRSQWSDLFGTRPDEPMLSWEEWNALQDTGPLHGPWHYEISEGYYERGRVRIPWPGQPAGKFRRAA
jgi:hypothetical protein